MSTRCHVATRKGLFTLDRSGSGWSISRVSFLGDNCTLVMHDPRNGDLMAALNHGHFGVKMHRSRDGGATWSEIATPMYPEKPADYVPKTTPAEGKPVDWSLKLVWALAPGGADEPGVVWCGTLPGRPVQIRRRRRLVGAESPACGTTRCARNGSAAAPTTRGFTRSASIRAISRHVLVGVSCGGVWSTRDGGETWQTRRARHARRVHAAGAPVRSERPGPAPGGPVPRRIPTCSGSSTTTGSSSRPMPPRRGARSPT